MKVFIENLYKESYFNSVDDGIIRIYQYTGCSRKSVIFFSQYTASPSPGLVIENKRCLHSPLILDVNSLVTIS